MWKENGNILKLKISLSQLQKFHGLFGFYYLINTELSWMYHHPDMVKCPHWLKAFVRQAPKMEGFIQILLHSFFWAVIYFRSSCRGAWTSSIHFLEECQKFTCQRCQIWWWRAGSWTRSVTPVSMCCSRREVMSQQPVTADLASGWSGFLLVTMTEREFT